MKLINTKGTTFASGGTLLTLVRHYVADQILASGLMVVSDWLRNPSTGDWPPPASDDPIVTVPLQRKRQPTSGSVDDSVQ